MTTWADDDDFTPSLILNRPGSAAGLDEPDTCTLEQYRRWQAQLPLFDDPLGRPLPETVRVREDIL